MKPYGKTWYGRDSEFPSVSAPTGKESHFEAQLLPLNSFECYSHHLGNIPHHALFEKKKKTGKTSLKAMNQLLRISGHQHAAFIVSIVFV